MLKPMKKIEKKESSSKQEEFEHQDAFLEKSYEAEHYVERNIELFKKYGTAVVAFIVIIIGYLQYDQSVAVEANGKFGMAMIDYTTGKLEQAKVRFENLKIDYSGSEAAERSKYFLAKLYLAEGKNEEARAELESYAGSDDLIAPAAYSALALTYENDKNYAEAASHYETAAAAEMRETTKIDYAISAAVNYELAEMNADAKRIYDGLLSDHDTFAKKSLVEQKLAML